MAHFNFAFHDHAFDLPLSNPSVRLHAAIGSWPGKKLDDRITVEIDAASPEFLFDPTGSEDDGLWVRPRINTQWLSIPTNLFANRDYRSLEGMVVDYGGEGTCNSLTGGNWQEAPGALHIHDHEFFLKAMIRFANMDQGLFEVSLAGATELGTKFDVLLLAPLTIRLSAYNGEGTEDDLYLWFDTFLDKDDFAFHRTQNGDDVHLTGLVRQ